MSSIQHRAGDTFQQSGIWTVGGSPVDLTGYTVEAPIVEVVGRELVSSATVTIDPDQTARRGQFSIEVAAAATAGWPVGKRALELVLRFTSSGGIATSSPPVLIDVLADLP